MSTNSKIEWTEATWNPITGCTKISLGCKNCYAEKLSMRLKAMGQPNYRNGFQPTLHEHMLDIPLRWKRPKTIFVNSMSDLFHDDVPTDFILRVFGVMTKAKQHRFQVLTKRPLRLLELSSKLPWPDNVWMGVSVENRDYIDRIGHLIDTPARIKFLSLEPLLGPMGNLNLNGIDWVIVGGESGPKSRPMLREWVTEVRDQCLGEGVPFFFKQWGGRNKKKSGRILDGRTWDEIPGV